jgi:hypothetical protein
MTLVSAQLTDWENSIFGVSGLAATGDDKNGTKNVSYIVGEFEKYAYGEQYKGQVELGKGLVGKILLDFQTNSQKEMAGWEALDAPTWERKLWCSDTFPGPSIREFSTMVASIAATVCTFGAGAMLAVAVSAAIMATNELTFELADVGVGYHDWDEAAKNVAKAAVSGAITGASGAAMGAASKVGGIGGVFLKTGITSSSSITTQFTNAFIDDGFSGVVDAFNSWSDWQGIAVTTGSAFISNSMSYAILGDQNINFASYNPNQIKDVVTAVNLGSGLLGNALEYAVTGETSFNLLNLSMFGLEYGSMWGAGGMQTLSGGLLEFHLGNSGIQFAVGSGGTDISIGTVVSALNGVSVIQKDNEINTYIQQHYGGDETTAQMLKSLYAQEEYGAQDTLEEILSGNLSKEEVAEKYFEVQLQVLNAILGVLTIDEETDSEEKSVLEKIEEREEEIAENGLEDTAQDAAGEQTEAESDTNIEEKTIPEEKTPEMSEEKKDAEENKTDAEKAIGENTSTTTAASTDAVTEQKAEAQETAVTATPVEKTAFESFVDKVKELRNLLTVANKKQEEKTYKDTIIKQKEIEQRFGYYNALCYGTTVINLYRLVSGMTDQQVNDYFSGDEVNKYITKPKADILSFEGLSLSISAFIGNDFFYNYVYPKENGWQILRYGNAEDFQQSSYQYGIGYYYTGTDYSSKPDHYELIVNNPYTVHNPGQKEYNLGWIYPIQQNTIRKVLKK